MNTFFLVLLVVLAVLAVIFVFGAVYVTRHEKRDRENFSNEASQRASTNRRGDGREFYKSLGLGTGEQVKIRLFTPKQYEGELGGDQDSLEKQGFIGSLKAYRQFDDDWYETPPEKAAAPLDLGENDYELDEEHRVLLLKKLPPGVPPAARELFQG